MRSFFGKINFVRMFITGFAQIMKPLNEMMKKDTKTEWTEEAKVAFSQVKQSILEVHVLTSPNYLRPFYIYSFASEHSCAAVLTQRIEEAEERQIAFMSSPFKNAEVKYPPLKKQDFALVKAVKKFQHYVLRSQIIIVVPDAAVKSLLMQSELGERRWKWMAILQEFDLEIHPTKLLRGTGLSQSMANTSDNIIF